MTTQMSILEFTLELVDMTYEVGLNVSKTCENALKEAMKRLLGLNSDFTSVCKKKAEGSYPAQLDFETRRRKHFGWLSPNTILD